MSQRNLQLETLAALVCYDHTERFFWSRTSKRHARILWDVLSQRGWKMTSEGISHPEFTKGRILSEAKENQ